MWLFTNWLHNRFFKDLPIACCHPMFVQHCVQDLGDGWNIGQRVSHETYFCLYKTTEDKENVPWENLRPTFVSTFAQVYCLQKFPAKICHINALRWDIRFAWRTANIPNIEHEANIVKTANCTFIEIDYLFWCLSLIHFTFVMK